LGGRLVVEDGRAKRESEDFANERIFSHTSSFKEVGGIMNGWD
jgi:hypothetical protein